jgi:DNA invertase Pin-like site-specific DNA recombinase
MRTILYTRTSTRGQTIDHQLTQAKGAGFKIDEVVADPGESGVTVPLSERPQGRRLFDMLRTGDSLVVRWIDRLGRNYRDVSDNLDAFMRKGVIVRTVIGNMTFDGSVTDPMHQAIRDSMLRFLAAMAQNQAEATKEAQRAGIRHARTGDEAGKKYRGRRPSYSREDFETVIAMVAAQSGPTEIARATGLSVQTVLRIRAYPESANTALVTWGL